MYERVFLFSADVSPSPPASSIDSGVDLGGAVDLVEDLDVTPSSDDTSADTSAQSLAIIADNLVLHNELLYSIRVILLLAFVFTCGYVAIKWLWHEVSKWIS